MPLPLAVIQALAIDIGTDLLPALALGAEPPSQRTMQMAPEPPSRPLMTRALALRTFLFYGVVEASLGMVGFFGFYLLEGWRFGDAFDAFDHIARQAATTALKTTTRGRCGLWDSLPWLARMRGERTTTPAARSPETGS